MASAANRSDMGQSLLTDEDQMLARAFAISLVLAPAQAGAVDGWTILTGPDVPILETVDPDFPRYDLGQQCKLVMPGTGPAVESARTACKAQQGRLAGLISYKWNLVSPAARRDCIKRTDSANGHRYSVLYMCVLAANFTIDNRESANRAAEMIARQNGKARIDSQTVGSIR